MAFYVWLHEKSEQVPCLQVLRQCCSVVYTSFGKIVIWSGKLILHGKVFHSIFSIWHGSLLSYLHGKKLTLVWLLWTVSIFSTIMLLWLVFSLNNIMMNSDSYEQCREYTNPLKFPSVCLDIYENNNKIILTLLAGLHNIIDIFHVYGTDPHGWIMLCHHTYQGG